MRTPIPQVKYGKRYWSFFNLGMVRMFVCFFCAIYLASLDRWIRVDARGNNTGNINARFSTKK